MDIDHYLPAGTMAADGYALQITPAQVGWQYSGLRVLDLAPGASRTLYTEVEELIVLPLGGACDVLCDGERFALGGRASVFEAVSDFVYVPRDSHVRINSAHGGRFALPSARAETRLAAHYVAAADVAVELRGAGAASRQVNNFCSPEALAADRLIAVEVLTPGGNTSSYPPHKHDSDVPGQETVLEEIYYFEVSGEYGFGYQRVYGSGPRREIDVLAEVRTGDAIVMPHGYHGPALALPGYDMYYLNVMAGPGERAWRFTDDPAHAWIRESWITQTVDPRLPLTAAPNTP